jgi:uncharacterized membrane protein
MHRTLENILFMVCLIGGIYLLAISVIGWIAL